MGFGRAPANRETSSNPKKKKGRKKRKRITTSLWRGMRTSRHDYAVGGKKKGGKGDSGPGGKRGRGAASPHLLHHS